MKCDELKAETVVPQGSAITLQMYGKAEVDDAIAELKQTLEDAKATAYAEMVDAGMRERRMKRALYKACANWARIAAMSFWNRWHDVNFRKWQKVKRKCINKAKEYK